MYLSVFRSRRICWPPLQLSSWHEGFRCVEGICWFRWVLTFVCYSRQFFSYSCYFYCVYELTGKHNKTSQCFALKQDFIVKVLSITRNCAFRHSVSVHVVYRMKTVRSLPYSGNLSSIIRPVPESLCNVPSLICQKRLPYIVLYLNLSSGFKGVVY